MSIHGACVATDTFFKTHCKYLQHYACCTFTFHAPIVPTLRYPCYARKSRVRPPRRTRSSGRNVHWTFLTSASPLASDGLEKVSLTLVNLPAEMLSEMIGPPSGIVSVVKRHLIHSLNTQWKHLASVRNNGSQAKCLPELYPSTIINDFLFGESQSEKASNQQESLPIHGSVTPRDDFLG